MRQKGNRSRRNFLLKKRRKAYYEPLKKSDLSKGYLEEDLEIRTESMKKVIRTEERY